MLLYLFLVLSHFIGLIAGDTISPVRDEVSGREGESVKLTCRYDTTANYPALYWYRHHSDLQAPQFILWKGAKSNTGQYIPDKRYKTQTTDTTTELTISRLTLADTGLYYCALPVRFGNAIKVTVTLADQSPVEPKLFVLSPLQGSRGPDVCLATGFRPREGEMVLTVQSNQQRFSTSSAVLSVKEKSYCFAKFSRETIDSCSLHSTVSKREDPAGHCPSPSPPPPPAPAPSSSPSYPPKDNNQQADLCADLHPEKAKLNFNLLLMNGIRVVFTKALAFNTILTIRAVLF